MKSNRETPKVARATAPDEPEEDILSSLPDSVLCHILSFLPTKYAAVTSVLSTRWKYLFLDVPKIDLDLDESLLLNPLEKQGCRTSVNHDFINFVNVRLMRCKTASITEFRLKCPRLAELPVINSWLTALLFRNVKVLEIEVPDSDSPPLCLPGGIFRSETLVDLKLSGRNIVFRIPKIVCFRNLKVLHLKHLALQSASKNFRLAEGYPLLEELRLGAIRFPKNNENKATLVVSIPTLKVLAIIDLREEFSRIDIETPHLQHLECQFLWISISEMEINCCRCESLCLLYRSYPYVENQWLLELLSKLNNVNKLHIAECFSKVLSKWADSLPLFPNLTYLELTATVNSVWSLLQLAPNLKTLVCKAIRFGKDFLENEPLPLCFVRTLTEIAIKSCEKSEEVFAAIRFFLEHVAVLEKMILKLHSSAELTTLNQLLNQRRRSPKCEIVLI